MIKGRFGGLADPENNRAWLRQAVERRDREELESILRAYDVELTKEFRFFLADVVAGKVKLSKLPRGGQKKSKTARFNDSVELHLGAWIVERVKRVWRERYGRKYRIHESAVDYAVAKLRKAGWKLKRQK